MQAAGAGYQREPQLDDLDSFLEANFQDLQSFNWAAPPAGNFNEPLQSPPIPSVFNYAQQQIPATLTSGDIFMSPWMPSTAHVSPQASENVQRSRPLSYDFGQSFDLPDIYNSTAPARDIQLQRAQSAGTPLLSNEVTASSPNFGMASADSGDLRVTFKDKQNTPPPDNKALSLAERNKQAQRRHRQRQKDRMGMLEGQVKQLTEEKQQLAAEKATLAGQNAILNQVLQMREEQLKRARTETLHQPNASDQHSLPEEQRSTPFRGAEVKEEVADSFQREGAISQGLAESLSSILTLTVREDQEIKLSPAQVKAMAPEEVSKMWAEYLSAMMKELEVVDSGPPDSRPGQPPSAPPRSEKRIKLLLQEVLVLLMRYALGDLHKMKTFVVAHVHSQSPISSERKELWRAAASSLKLSEQQKHAILQLRKLFLKKQGSLICERLRVIARLQNSIPNPASSHDIALQFLKTEQSVDALQTILHKENQLIVDLVYTFLLKVVTPVQAARCLVQTFPSYPDTLCIFTWIAAHEGEEDAISMLGLPKQETHTSSPSQSNDHSY